MGTLADLQVAVDDLATAFASVSVTMAQVGEAIEAAFSGQSSAAPVRETLPVVAEAPRGRAFAFGRLPER